MRTPTTPDGERRYDHLDPLAAVRAAWTITGPRPDWHELAKDRVRAAMPLLGRALDRLAGDNPDGYPIEWDEEAPDGGTFHVTVKTRIPDDPGELVECTCRIVEHDDDGTGFVKAQLYPSAACPLHGELVDQAATIPNDVAKCPECGRQTRSYSRGCSECGYGRPA